MTLAEAALATTAPSAAATLRATLNYTRKTGERPVAYAVAPPPGVPRASHEEDLREVTLHDARRYEGWSLDTTGFDFVPFESRLRRWDDHLDARRVESVVYPEVRALLQAHTGADEVLVFDHTLRDSGARPDSGLREPVHRVHDDQTAAAAARRVRRHLPPDEAERRLADRHAIVNVWRPIGGSVQRDPLALCDARTIDDDDLIESDLVYADWVGQTLAVAWNPRHRWYWRSRQAPTEATLIKVQDSAADSGIARLSAHTAFTDPTAAPDAPPRRSIELRCLLFW